ncbi:MAG: tetratricopeptide repeat protein [Calditrichae bacterium]|nr:tetratricopeptide repeat protein [Calditrichia bacterium]
MNDNLKIFLYMILTIAFIGCGGSKDEIVLDEETPETLLQKGEIAYENGKYDDSIKLARLMLDYFPTSDLHIDAQLLITKTLGAQEKYEDQFDLLLRILKENIIPEKVPSIYMQIGEFYENSAKWNPGTVTIDSADFTNAADYYKKAVFYPNSDDRGTKANALYRMGLMHAKLNDIEVASKAYQELITTYPESPYSTLARTKLADPTNTDELPLPTPTTTTATPGTEEPVTIEDETAPPPPAETVPAILTPVAEDEPGKIELPDDDDEEPSILDSLQTIDEDSSDF